MRNSTSESKREPFDPVFVHASREAAIILAAWAICLVWSVATCRLMGYELETEDLPITLGMPHWVFVGVLVPWIGATVFSIWFALFYMKDDDLGIEEVRAEDPDDE